MNLRSTDKISCRIKLAIAWCLGYSPSIDRDATLNSFRDYFYRDVACPQGLQSIVDAASTLISDNLEHPRSISELQSLIQSHLLLWDNRIGIVYGGATKIKQYVFEAAKLQEIRGASALLDNINLVDLPALFHGDEDPSNEYFSECQNTKAYCQKIRHEWLEADSRFGGLSKALIPELIIYSTGGNILTFCPSTEVDRLADAIEKRYTHETLTANSCAVGAIFKPLEVRFGLLPDRIDDNTFWSEKYQQAHQNSDIKKFLSAYISVDDIATSEELWKAFCNKKSFNELTSKLATLFNQRRSGNLTGERQTRQFPVMFETHPYLRRDGGDKRSAIVRATLLPGEPWYSESAARKRLVGQIAKRDDSPTYWYDKLKLKWQPNRQLESWVNKFENFLKKHDLTDRYFSTNRKVLEARSLRQIGNACRGFVAYIYADGNNMGGYIQKIKTPQEYQKFSQDIFTATEQSVYKALFEHLRPHQLWGLTDPEDEQYNGKWIHPFEIIAIGGDDVMLIVPADKGLAIAQTLGVEFEAHLAAIPEYQVIEKEDLPQTHRYAPSTAKPSASSLSMSTGVLMTAETTPIYYAEDLTSQLLKSAKERLKAIQDRAKHLKQPVYHGGTVDFLVLKSVTMISSNIKEFRKEGLVKKIGGLTLQFYAAPYTLHELEGLLKVVKLMKDIEFPKSQLYQIRSLLDRGKRTAILNYRYLRVRLKDIGQLILEDEFERGWCKAVTNDGSVAPWRYRGDPDDAENKIYETIWRDIVDLYDFIPTESSIATPEVKP